MIRGVGRQILLLGATALTAGFAHYTVDKSQRVQIDALLGPPPPRAVHVDRASPAADTPHAGAQQGEAPEEATAETTVSPDATDPHSASELTDPTPDGGANALDGAITVADLIATFETTISIEQAAALYNVWATDETGAAEVHFLDARTPEKFAEGRVAGALNVTPQSFFDGSLPEEIEYWPKDAPIVVYCDGGDCDASHQVQVRLAQAKGFENVFIIGDGYPKWVEAGLPTESDQ